MVEAAREAVRERSEAERVRYERSEAERFLCSGGGSKRSFPFVSNDGTKPDRNVPVILRLQDPFQSIGCQKLARLKSGELDFEHFPGSFRFKK